MILYILDLETFAEKEYSDNLTKKQLQHRAGQYLLEKALGKDVYDRVEFSVGAHGKPYIVDYPIHFNISHSGRYILLVTGASEVGVDIQECKEVKKEAIAKRFFTEEELGAVKQDCDSFYGIWCRKEAYGKFLGVGLTEEVLSTNVLQMAVDESTVSQPDIQQERNYQFHDFSFLEGYQISVCSRKDENIEKIVCVFEGL